MKITLQATGCTLDDVTPAVLQRVLDVLTTEVEPGDAPDLDATTDRDLIARHELRRRGHAIVGVVTHGGMEKIVHDDIRDDTLRAWARVRVGTYLAPPSFYRAVLAYRELERTDDGVPTDRDLITQHDVHRNGNKIIGTIGNDWPRTAPDTITDDELRERTGPRWNAHDALFYRLVLAYRELERATAGPMPGEEYGLHREGDAIVTSALAFPRRYHDGLSGEYLANYARNTDGVLAAGVARAVLAYRAEERRRSATAPAVLAGAS